MVVSVSTNVVIEAVNKGFNGQFAPGFVLVLMSFDPFDIEAIGRFAISCWMP
jgi:hypothetical protein